MRMTHATVAVAIALLEDLGARQWGYDLGKRAGVRPGVLYPVLHRMFDEGWLSDGWEEHTPDAKRPPRRYYEVTEKGVRELGAFVDHAKRDARFLSLRPASAS